jgi:hypothetical protein
MLRRIVAAVAVAHPRIACTVHGGRVKTGGLR